MCKRIFKALKIKMDNYHLRYELASADEEITKLREKLKNFENVENEIGCPIDVFWKVYRRLSGHGSSNIHLYTISNKNEVLEILPTQIISGTYSNYPNDCSFGYRIWDKENKFYKNTFSYFHFHDYNEAWFLDKNIAQKQIKQEKCSSAFKNKKRSNQEVK